MQRIDVLRTFARHRGDSPAVTGPSFGGRMLYGVDHRKATLYNMELSYPSSVCLGLAMSLPTEHVYAIEGDGSMLAGMSTLATIARYSPPNLTILVMNNRSYASTGSVPTATGAGKVDLVAAAKGLGIEHAVAVANDADLDENLKLARTCGGPSFIVAELDPEDVRTSSKSPALPFDIVEATLGFRRDLEDRGLVPTIWAV
ncbi:thiamine pyrophosphate-dependent enzyme [Nonomuraea sp. NPDC049486]|uniref:thiamine pyrophosphate-dependent enzyme n=1 Tax=Nonomuraea sp. NPDC049486 TaxID=3155773 RepID=UPI00341EC220